ncbi:hypothetical protein [Chryseobacterium sp. RU33C]|uniref:hypothetical protein n=1 Tax=Chryseobacterium sp. RU33C TaxID=1907398 RepID=UPI00095432C8|nr:hypothetical protein [Chryseobacterium sp. RU33C]SIR64181.1 hypothetical protein SAMN05880573_13118 [Chryseobacterium sp. RU33C]
MIFIIVNGLKPISIDDDHSALRKYSIGAGFSPLKFITANIGFSQNITSGLGNKKASSKTESSYIL